MPVFSWDTGNMVFPRATSGQTCQKNDNQNKQGGGFLSSSVSFVNRSFPPLFFKPFPRIAEMGGRDSGSVVCV